MAKKRIALLLSSGAAKGFAHLGVLKVLEKNKIMPDLIVGTSMGALVGAHYAYVPNADYWIDKLGAFSVFEAVGLNDIKFGIKGLITGTTLKMVIDKNLSEANFKDTVIPLIINATDLITNKNIKFDKGRLSDAVRASISIPILFDVVKKENKLIADGGILDPIGSRWIKNKKFDLIIAVNVNTADQRISKNMNPMNLFWKTFELMQRAIVHEKVKEFKNVVLIEPDMSEFSQIDFHKAKKMVLCGEKAAEKALGKIKKFI